MLGNRMQLRLKTTRMQAVSPALWFIPFMLQHESPLDQGRLDLCSVNEAYEIPTTKIGAR